MMQDTKYVVFLFASVSHALKAEKILKTRNIASKLIPVPREIRSDCGVCLRVARDQQEMVVELLQGSVDWEEVAFL